MPEVRVDPLSGQRAIVAGDRAGRPGGGFEVLPAPAIDPETDPFAEGTRTALRPSSTPCVRTAALPTRPDGRSAWCRTCIQPCRPDSPEPEREANPDLFWAGPARGAHEVIINSPQPVISLSQLSIDDVGGATDVWRERMRAHEDAAYVHLIVNERREAGASLPHTHAQLYALDFVPAAIARERERFRAYATRTMGGNLLADLVQEEVRRRERVVAIDEETVLMAPYGARVPFQLMIAPRVPRMRYEDDGPSGGAMLHDALSRLSQRLGACAAAESMGANRAGGRRALLLANRHPAPAHLPGWAGARGGREPQHRRSRADRLRAAGALSGVRALVQRVSRASVSVEGRVVSEIGPGLLVLLGVGRADSERDADWLADKVRSLRVFADGEGRMNEPLGEREVLCVSQFTLYGDARKGNRPSYVSAAPPETAEPLYERFCERLGARHGVFGAMMAVELVNEGPVTVLVESPG